MIEGAGKVGQDYLKRIEEIAQQKLRPVQRDQQEAKEALAGETPLTREDEKLAAVARELRAQTENQLQFMQSQIQNLERRCWGLEQTIGRFQRIFDGIVREEIDRRLNGTPQSLFPGDACGQLATGANKARDW